MTNYEASRLKCAINAMPPFVGKALDDFGLMDAYLSRPPYQRNDYVGWITRQSAWKRERSALPRCWMSWPAATVT